jgi:hypothetical protein
VGVRTVQVVTCDECGCGVDQGAENPWVDASVYGKAFHLDCWRRIGGPRVARVLYLDEIVMKGGLVAPGTRAWGPKEERDG